MFSSVSVNRAVLGSLAKEFPAEACPMKDCIIPGFTPHTWTLNACFQVLVSRYWPVGCAI